MHDSIGVAEQVLKDIGPKNGFEVTCWRYTADQITPWVLDRLGEMTNIYGR